MNKDLLEDLDRLMKQHLEIGLSLEGGIDPELIPDLEDEDDKRDLNS